MNEKRDQIVADPHIVKAMTNHLLAAFNQFIRNYPGNVDHVDGFMAAHNFHKTIVLDMVKQEGDLGLVGAAVETFMEGLFAELERYPNLVSNSEEMIETQPVLTRRRLRAKPFFRWFDFWIGAYVDVEQAAVYVCFLPMVGIKFWLEGGFEGVME